jgi:hypothetical protein
MFLAISEHFRNQYCITCHWTSKRYKQKEIQGAGLGEKGIYISSKLANSLIDPAVYSTLGPINR